LIDRIVICKNASTRPARTTTRRQRHDTAGHGHENLQSIELV
jgi:hypothetical protein